MFFLNFFKRRKRKKEQEAGKNEARILADFLGTNEDFTYQYLQNGDNKSEMEHFILDRCEQILEHTKELDEVKDEYYDVIGYLNDLQTIKTLPKDELEAIQDSAKHIVKLRKKQEEYLLSTKKLESEQFIRIRDNEQDLPDIIRRMKENESYHAMIRRDMGYLEGEKQTWVSKKEQLKREEKVLKSLSIFLFSAFFLLCIGLFIFELAFDMEIQVPFLILICACAVVGVGVYWRLQNDRRDFRLAEKNMNYAITLLNKVKIKYVNTTNAIDYTSGRFQVKNSYELEYQWDKYLEALKEQESLRQLRSDLLYYKRQMKSRISKGLLNNVESWCIKPELFLDEHQQLLVQQELYNRQENLHKKIEDMAEKIRSSRGEIDRILKRQPNVSRDIRTILASIDRLLKKGRWS